MKPIEISPIDCFRSSLPESSTVAKLRLSEATLNLLERFSVGSVPTENLFRMRGSAL